MLLNSPEERRPHSTPQWKPAISHRTVVCYCPSCVIYSQIMPVKCYATKLWIMLQILINFETVRGILRLVSWSW